MSTVSYCPTNLTTSCAPCRIAAYTTLHSFPYSLATITVEATPYIYPEGNGSSSTSWKYVTITKTISGSETEATGTNDAVTFSHPTGVTWKTRDLTLTYPTTYVEYNNFAGAGPSSNTRATCAQTSSLDQFNLFSQTVEMSFIMPWSPTTATSSIYSAAATGPARSLPPGILSYLDSIPAVTSQLGGHPIESCLNVNAPSKCYSSRSNQCTSTCFIGVPTSTVFFTYATTSIHTASTETLTAYSWNSPSYTYKFHPESTVIRTRTSSSKLYNTAGNHTGITCQTICSDRSLPTSYSSDASQVIKTTAPAFSTFTLETASVLTTINKAPVYATIPAGIDDGSTPNPNSSPTKRSSLLKSATTYPAAPTTRGSMTAKLTISKGPSSRTSSPTAIPVQGNLDHDSAANTPVVHGSPESLAVITAGSQTLTVSKVQPGLYFAGATISAGKDLTMSNGNVVHVESDEILLGTSTIEFNAVEAAGFYVINHQTLIPGGAATEGTMTLSLDRSGQTYWVNGVSTTVVPGIIEVGGAEYPAQTMATTTDAGAYILGGISPETTTSSPDATVEKSGNTAANGSETGFGSGTDSMPSETASRSDAPGFPAPFLWILGLAALPVLDATM